jgi:hypothetical protein
VDGGTTDGESVVSDGARDEDFHHAGE